VFVRVVAPHSAQDDGTQSQGVNAHQEIAMQFNGLGRFIAWLTQSHVKTVPAQSGPAAASSSVFEFDPMWHGDHWQNLLSAPMDARRYVMEDWSASLATDWNEADGTAPVH
jgi:hypothetical protein